jgi:hypothetical protein
MTQLDTYAATLGMRREPAKERMTRTHKPAPDKILDICGLPPVSAYPRVLRGRVLSPFTRSLMVGASGVALYTDSEKTTDWYEEIRGQDPSAKGVDR